MTRPDRHEDFKTNDFPPRAGSFHATTGSYVYVFSWIRDGVESAFYVGQTKRLAERIKDYCAARFAACTDFRIGEAVRYLRDSQRCRIVVRYRATKDALKDESRLIRELHFAGVRLLNDFPSYNYRTANEIEERTIVQRYCDVVLSSSQAWNTSEIDGQNSELRDAGRVVAQNTNIPEQSALTNHTRFAEAFKEFANKELSTAQIKMILKARYSGFSDGSVLPNDHAEGNANACWCAGTDWRIFDKLKRNLYRVRPSAPPTGAKS